MWSFIDVLYLIFAIEWIPKCYLTDIIKPSPSSNFKLDKNYCGNHWLLFSSAYNKTSQAKSSYEQQVQRISYTIQVSHHINQL